MSLRAKLKEIVVNTGGGIGAVIMGYDGIAIDEYFLEEPFDMQLMAVEYATVLKEIKRAVDVLHSGSMEEVAINTDAVRAVFRVVTEDYFVLLAIHSDGNYGKGRYLLQRELPEIRALLS